MFRKAFLRNKQLSTIGNRLVQLLQEYPEMQNPPSAHPPDVPNAHGFCRITESNISATCRAKMPADSVERSIHARVISYMTSDRAAMRARCGDPTCPGCRLPEHMQPDERRLWHHDLIKWYNASRGKCMSCRRVLARSRLDSKVDGYDNVWTIQREDHRINHVASNVVGVLCHSCRELLVLRPIAGTP